MTRNITLAHSTVCQSCAKWARVIVPIEASGEALKYKAKPRQRGP